MGTDLGPPAGQPWGDGINRPRILVLSTKSPFPPRGGDDVRLMGLLRAAAGLGDTTLAVWGENRGSATEEVEIRTFPLTRLTILSGALGHALSGRPLIVGPYARRFPVIEGHWDLVVGFQLKTWRWAQAVGASIHVLDLVDSLSQYARSEGLPLLKKLQLLAIGTEETRAVRYFDQTWISTEADRSQIAGVEDGKVEVVPNGPLVVKALPRLEPGKSLLFVGNLVYPPNRQGIEWFLKEVWPQLVPDGFSLDLVGNGSENFGQVPGVSAHGVVPELESFYAKADLAISPVQWGGGSQLKIWEALGYGRSVIVTSAGSASFDPCPGILIADGAEKWVASIRRAVGSGVKTTREIPSVTQNMGRVVATILKRGGGVGDGTARCLRRPDLGQRASHDRDP